LAILALPVEKVDGIGVLPAFKSLRTLQFLYMCLVYGWFHFQQKLHLFCLSQLWEESFLSFRFDFCLPWAAKARELLEEAKGGSRSAVYASL
jgi:hypothetical protein